MRLRGDTGIWEIFIPDVGIGTAYKYEILGPDGGVLPLKADPFARASEMRPATASKVAGWPDHEWGDAAHRAHWATTDPAANRSRSTRSIPARGGGTGTAAS